MQLARVKIPAVWFGGNQTADFKLGLGPCGKVVVALRLTVGDVFITLYQEHEDGTLKYFYYRVADLVGRIEEEYT